MFLEEFDYLLGSEFFAANWTELVRKITQAFEAGAMLQWRTLSFRSSPLYSSRQTLHSVRLSSGFSLTFFKLWRSRIKIIWIAESMSSAQISSWIFFRSIIACFISDFIVSKAISASLRFFSIFSSFWIASSNWYLTELISSYLT